MTAPILYPYQRRYLADSSRFKAGMWSRQTGKTFTTTLEAVLDVLDAESQGRTSRWTILSVSRDRALDAMDSGVKLHLRAIGAAFEALDVPFAADELAHMVRIGTRGSYIRAVASKPSTARGMSDNLILDEFAHHQDNRAIWTALLPVVSRPDLKLREISTPNGRGDKFYEIMTAPDSIFSRHVVTIYDAVADLLRRYREEHCSRRDGGRWERLRIDRLLGESRRHPTPDPLVHVPLSQIGPEHFAAWRDRRLREVSAGTVARELNLLSGICALATHEWRWLTSHPPHFRRRDRAHPTRVRRRLPDGAGQGWRGVSICHRNGVACWRTVRSAPGRCGSGAPRTHGARRGDRGAKNENSPAGAAIIASRGYRRTDAEDRRARVCDQQGVARCAVQKSEGPSAGGGATLPRHPRRGAHQAVEKARRAAPSKNQRAQGLADTARHVLPRERGGRGETAGLVPLV